MTQKFVHLHNHSDFSLLDGAASVKKLVAKAKELGMSHLALTYPVNFFGAIEFIRRRDLNKKPTKDITT